MLFYVLFTNDNPIPKYGLQPVGNYVSVFVHYGLSYFCIVFTNDNPSPKSDVHPFGNVIFSVCSWIVTNGNPSPKSGEYPFGNDFSDVQFCIDFY